MKVHKIEVMVWDFDEVGEKEIRQLIENTKFVHAHTMNCTSKEVQWDDSHPLNSAGTMARAYTDLFSD